MGFQSWTPIGCMRIAFERMGTAGAIRTRETKRSLDAAAIVAGCFRDWQGQCLQQAWLSCITNAQDSSWCWLSVAWDETPLRLEFGMLEDL